MCNICPTTRLQATEKIEVKYNSTKIRDKDSTSYPLMPKSPAAGSMLAKQRTLEMWGKQQADILTGQQQISMQTNRQQKHQNPHYHDCKKQQQQQQQEQQQFNRLNTTPRQDDVSRQVRHASRVAPPYTLIR